MGDDFTNRAQLIQKVWVWSAGNGLNSAPADVLAHKHDRVSQAFWHPILKTLMTTVAQLLLRCYGSNDRGLPESPGWLAEGQRGQDTSKGPFLKQSDLSSEIRDEKTQQCGCTQAPNLPIKTHLGCLHATFQLMTTCPSRVCQRISSVRRGGHGQSHGPSPDTLRNCLWLSILIYIIPCLLWAARDTS